MTKLRLLAQDETDLRVLAAALQDAIVRMSDLSFSQAERAFSFRAYRFKNETKRTERTNSGIRIDGVLGVRSRGLAREKADAVAVLLDIAFKEADTPAGVVTLSFSGQGEIELDVEALDVILADIGETVRTRAKPKHDL